MTRSTRVVACLAALGAGAGAAPVPPFRYGFDTPGTLEEAGSMSASTSPYWWLNSGGRLRLTGVGATVQGDLPPSDRWRLAYAASNPVDTDGGYHPQNLFRLVTKSRWTNVRAQVHFRITADNLSASPNRNASNGVLLFSRFRDQHNLYYAGVRVDGAAVIKKKIGGAYHTLASTRLVSGAGYDRSLRPNLLPKSVWWGLRSETTDGPGGSVRLRLLVERRPGAWELALDVTDDGVRFGGPALRGPGHAGLRTDFMDVSFDNYSATPM